MHTGTNGLGAIVSMGPLLEGLRTLRMSSRQCNFRRPSPLVCLGNLFIAQFAQHDADPLAV